MVNVNTKGEVELLGVVPPGATSAVKIARRWEKLCVISAPWNEFFITKDEEQRKMLTGRYVQAK